MAVVSTGQITIVDNNDARPLTAYITCNPGPQQVFSKDESTISWTPDWTTINSSTGLILTAKVFAGGAGGAQDVTGQLTNAKFCLTPGGTAITGTATLISANAEMNAVFLAAAGRTFTVVHNSSGSTFTIKGNLKDTVAQQVVYFEADYTDPVTGLVSRIVTSIVLGLVKTGTNAVYVLTRGQTSIEQATGQTKNVGVVAANLIRAAGADTSGVTYRFFENNGATHISNTMTTKYGLKTVAPTANPTGAIGDIGLNLPAANAWTSHNTLVIHESAVTDIGVYKVEAKDSDNITYQAFFTIYDLSDPYDTRILSSAGDKLQNGIGSTDLVPLVYYGSSQVTNLTGWTFTWTFFDKDGKRAAFIDTNKTALAGGRDITANEATTFTFSGTGITFAVGDIIKVVKANGEARYFEIGTASTAGVATIRTTGLTNSWLSYTAPTASEFVNGKLYACTPAGQRTTAAGAAITVTGDEIDVKGTIRCQADRP
ncbi:MAG: hypothetical protein B7Z19_02335 [Polynucleobacter sp. 32-46-5]|nr:MAG: hypothetical protein B7Z19_02335 [Polynucleobacter sp. 32-46-5]